MSDDLSKVDWGKPIEAYHDDGRVAAKRSAIGLACGAVADAVFYHNSDRHQRTKLANALVDLTRALERDSREG